MKKLRPGQLLTYNNTAYQVACSKNGTGCYDCAYNENILREPVPCLKCLYIPDTCHLENISTKHIYVLHPKVQGCRDVTVKLSHSQFISLLQLKRLCRRDYFAPSLLTMLSPVRFVVENSDVKSRLNRPYLVELVKKLSEDYEKLNIG